MGKRKAVSLRCSVCGESRLLLYGINAEEVIFICDECEAMIITTYEELIKIGLEMDKGKKKKKNGR